MHACLAHHPAATGACQRRQDRNDRAAFDRHADGSLTPIAGSPFNAGGAGTGAPYGSAGGLQRSTDGRYLLATDPASNQISVLRIKPNGGLQLADVVEFPRAPAR